MFWSKNKKNRYTPAYPSFFYIKVGLNGVSIAQTCPPDINTFSKSVLFKMLKCLYKLVTVSSNASSCGVTANSETTNETQNFGS